MTTTDSARIFEKLDDLKTELHSMRTQIELLNNRPIPDPETAGRLQSLEEWRGLQGRWFWVLAPLLCAVVIERAWDHTNRAEAAQAPAPVIVIAPEDLEEVRVRGRVALPSP